MFKESTRDGTRTTSQNERYASLIGRISQGDEDAMTHLYRETRPLLRSVAQQVLGDAGATEEVLMDCYLQVWRTAERYDWKRGTPLAWLLTIARSRALDRRRSMTRQTRLEEDEWPQIEPASPTQDPEEASFSSEKRRYVHRALRHLSPEQRQVIFSAYFEGLSQGEIARRFNLPLGTIKTRVRLAMRHLRESIVPSEMASLVR